MTKARSVTRGARTPLLLACALLGTTTFTAAPAHAVSPEYEVGAFGGVHLWNPNNGLGRPAPTTLNSFDQGGAFGIRLGLGLHARFMLEGELALVPTTAPNGQAYIADTDTYARIQVLGVGYRLHALINLLTGRVRPFLLLGGGGLTLSSANSSVATQETTGSLDAGVGLKVDVRPHWGLRLDARALLVPGAGMSSPLVPDGEILLALYGRFGETKGGLQPPPDDDKDGIPNAQDQCPKAAGPLENKGCPIDSDGDGIPDEQDKCQYEKGVAEFKGCFSAATLDSDGDGIVDEKDRCPDAAETKNGYMDYDGCPDTLPPAALLPFLGTVAGVAFETDRADLTAASLPVLDRAVTALREHGAAKLEIAGYTDNSGDPTANQDLSQKRADAVKAYLISKGIDATRLTSKGFGAESPLYDNATPEGREKNRRVEFHFVN